MSRGLYQLSYGSNRRNMPPFPPFGKKKKTFRREFPDRRSVGSPSSGPAPFLSCPSSGIATKKALSPEGKRAWLPARPEGIRRSPTFAGQRRGNDARQETTVFYGNSHYSGGRRNAILQPIRREVRMQTRRSSAESFPARALMLTEPGNIRGDARRPGRFRELQGLRAHSRSSGSATRGACRT